MFDLSKKQWGSPAGERRRRESGGAERGGPTRESGGAS